MVLSLSACRIDITALSLLDGQRPLDTKGRDHSSKDADSLNNGPRHYGLVLLLIYKVLCVIPFTRLRGGRARVFVIVFVRVRVSVCVRMRVSVRVFVRLE